MERHKFIIALSNSPFPFLNVLLNSNNHFSEETSTGEDGPQLLVFITLLAPGTKTPRAALWNG